MTAPLVTPDPGFGIYVHWPFCLAKCPYCDFNSHVRHAPVDEARFISAFARELGHRAALTPGRQVESIFFGGGTPSLMHPATVGAILDEIGRHWALAPGAEITLEANPTSVEAERFRGYRAAGVNRVSLGVQAMKDADLKALGRVHSASEAMAALEVAAAIFERFTFDLLYARPGQSVSGWRAELREALRRAASHMSLYQLTIEPGTMFERLHKAGRLAIPDPDLARALYDLTQEVCEAEGLPAYEISNHARPGAESRHNLVYWRYGEYAAAGPGAHARLTTSQGRESFVFEKHPETWLEAVERGSDAVIENELLGPEAQGDEMLLMGLRLREGVSPARHAGLTGRGLDEGRIAALIGDGLLERTEDGRIRATAQGVPVIDAIVAELAA